MTDGWYGIRVQLDEYLQNLLREKKIFVGQKLYIQGAELCGSDVAVSPLEVCEQHSVYLRVSSLLIYITGPLRNKTACIHKIKGVYISACWSD
jgi:tartrate dehydratase beta subunit/fumarate hydratase class I family protein